MNRLGKWFVAEAYGGEVSQQFDTKKEAVGEARKRVYSSRSSRILVLQCVEEAFVEIFLESDIQALASTRKAEEGA